MAEMKEFDDLELRLRAHPLGEASPHIAQDLLEAGTSLLVTERRRNRLLLAAAALMLILNLVTERHVSSQAETKAGPPAPSVAVREFEEALAAANGCAADWLQFQALVNLPHRTRTYRLRPPGDVLEEVKQ